MGMYSDTSPAAGDELCDSFRKINQVLATGRAGTAHTMFADTSPSASDTPSDSARKINQLINTLGGV